MIENPAGPNAESVRGTDSPSLSPETSAAAPAGAASGLSRRQFGALSAAAGFSIVSGRTLAQQETSAEVLKIGLIGCGGRGSGAAMQMLEGNENVKLIALADAFQDRVDDLAKKLRENPNAKIRGKSDVQPDHMFVGLDACSKICDTDIDVLLIGTIPYCKPEMMEICAAKGKHVFIEKPVAVDPVGIRKFIAATKLHQSRGLSLVAGTQRRHQKEYQQTIEKIHAGEIGDVLALRAYWCDNLPWARNREAGWKDVEYRLRNWLNYCWTSGDSIVEQHVHNLDVCNWVMRDHPSAVFASGGRSWKPADEKFGDNWDHFDCDYEYANGVHILSKARHWDGCDKGVFEEAVGSKGRSNCSDRGEKGNNPYVQEHIDLVNSIRGTGPKWHEGVQVAESTMTAIMGRMSAYTGKKLTWDEAINSELSIVPDPLNFDVACPVWSVPVPVDSKVIARY